MRACVGNEISGLNVWNFVLLFFFVLSSAYCVLSYLKAVSFDIMQVIFVVGLGVY